MLRSAATLFLLIACCAGAASGATPQPGSRVTLKLASWNLEWLMTPVSFNALKATCTPSTPSAAPGRRPAGVARSIPCDVAARLERGRADFAALARYARVLDADVIALQEVDGPEAAALVFPAARYRFCFTAARAVQNTGFAIRRGIPYRCGADYTPLALGARLRRGATLVLYPGTPAAVHLLGVHLKSGCARGPLSAAPRADSCALLARQVPALETWIDNAAVNSTRFAVLGDFNRDLLAERGPARSAEGAQLNVWPEIDDGDPPGARLLNSAAGERFSNCVRGALHSGYIDQILLGPALAAARVRGSFEHLTYSARDAWRHKLSDHCPIAIRITLETPGH